MIVWKEIRARPWAEQVDVVRHHLRFSTRAFLYLLGEKSCEEGRKDPQAGIRIARLALEYAAAFEGEAEDGYGVWRAVAWTWIGNAKRLALDTVGAENAFSTAKRLLPERDERAK